MASFYIASRLENASAVRKLAEVLKTWGHRHTYDWTVHGSVFDPKRTQEENEFEMSITARKEHQGVYDADVVIVLTPGGRGTNVELGIALGLKKQVIISGLDRDLCGADGRPCAFYFHPSVKRLPLNHGLILSALL